MKEVLLNPFEKFSEQKLLLFGIVITLIGSYLGYLFSGRFDGVLDLHFNNEVTLAHPFIDNAINIFSLSIALFWFGRIINKKTRFIDILIPSLVARLPFYILPFTNTNNFMVNFSDSILKSFYTQNPIEFHLETFDLIGLLAFAALSIAALIWFVLLLFKGFKVATNCKTPNHTLLFVFGIIVAEILSKALIYFSNT